MEMDPFFAVTDAVDKKTSKESTTTMVKKETKESSSNPESSSLPPSEKEESRNNNNNQLCSIGLGFFLSIFTIKNIFFISNILSYLCCK